MNRREFLSGLAAVAVGQLLPAPEPLAGVGLPERMMTGDVISLDGSGPWKYAVKVTWLPPLVLDEKYIVKVSA